MGCCFVGSSQTEVLINEYLESLSIRSSLSEDFFSILALNMKKEISLEGFRKSANNLLDSKEFSGEQYLEKWINLFEVSDSKIHFIAALFFLCEYNVKSFNKGFFNFLEKYAASELLREADTYSVSVTFIKKVIALYVDLVTIEGASIMQDNAAKKEDFLRAIRNGFNKDERNKEASKGWSDFNEAFIEIDDFIEIHYTRLTKDSEIRKSILESNARKVAGRTPGQ